MRIYPSNAHEFYGKTTYTIWDEDECGGYGCFSEEAEALTEAKRLLISQENYGHHPWFDVIAVVPSRHTGFYNRHVHRFILSTALESAAAK